jgi:hypothetical protein
MRALLNMVQQSSNTSATPAQSKTCSVPAPSPYSRAMSKAAPSVSVPKNMQWRYDQIVALTDAFCHQHLNHEYATLAQRMAATLCRKRPSPLLSGQPQTWACGIVHSLGQINFLSDPATKPHMTLAQICTAFGVAQSTATNKAADIRRLLRAHRFDPKWSLPSLLDKNPLIWMLKINGIIVDIRSAPRQIQELALKQGLIPQLPEEQP